MPRATHTPGILAAGAILAMCARGTAAGGCERLWLPTFGGESGVNDAVLAFTVHDDGSGPALYAGGRFAGAGGVAASRVARWDGTSWSALGAGIDNTVFALAVFDDGSGGGPALFAGGFFTSAGGVPASSIARWDGSSWSALGSGVDATIYALAVFDDGSGPALYAGGNFFSAGGVAASGIARWDGSAWEAVGGGTDDSVFALVVHDDGSGPALYAGGAFTSIDGMPANRMARWDGQSWAALGSGTNNNVDALAVYDEGSGAGPALYAGGLFTGAGGGPASFVARWDGQSWAALGSGMNSGVFALTVHDDGSGAGPALYAGGYFTSAGGVAASGLARLDGDSWSPLHSGTSAGVVALAVFDEPGTGDAALFAGGYFTSAGGVTASRIARWDGATLSAVGESGGLDGSVFAIKAYDDGGEGGPALYAGGSFTAAGGAAAACIGRWDGSVWSPLDSGLNGVVLALAVYDDGGGSGPVLCAGGAFTSASGVGASRIARWDGSSWSGLGDGLSGGSTGAVNALTVYDDGRGAGPALYAGGEFTSAGAVAASRIARWDGASWSSLGSGINGDVRALAVYDDGQGSGPALYAGGWFTGAGAAAANFVARWDGTSWSALGSGLNNGVFALAVFDDGSGAGPALYAGGLFTAAGGAAASFVARWDGTSWSSLGGGVNGAVFALAGQQGGDGEAALYVGGFFTAAGGLPASRIATWDGASWSALGSGLNDAVTALAVGDGGASGPALYVGGLFSSAIDSGDSYLARWACDEAVPGDVTGDGVVDVLDLVEVILAFGDCQPARPCPADLNGDGTVDVPDLVLVILNWS